VAVTLLATKLVGVLTIGVTVTEQVANFPFELVALISDVPVLSPVINPALVTVATKGLLDVQVNVLSVALLGATVAVNWNVEPLAIDCDTLFSVIDSTGIAPVVNSTVLDLADSSSPSVSVTWNVYLVLGFKSVIVAVNSVTVFK
jgi:hypothetical protein